MAFVATDTHGDAEEIHGIARYTRNPDGSSCEFAIVVEDAWQGRGLGVALMMALEACARGRGLREMIGLVLAENSEMARMMTRLGFEGRTEPDDPAVMRFVKRL